MKDPSENIRQWLFDILNLTVQYNGSYVPCYSFVPKDTAMPFIVLGEQYMEADESTKDSFITLNSVNIEIYASYTGNDASYKMVNSLSEDILELITADPITEAGSGGENVGGIDGYREINIMVGSIATQRVLMDNNIVIMKSIVIKFRLEEE
jgi:hypothetical protein